MSEIDKWEIRKMIEETLNERFDLDFLCPVCNEYVPAIKFTIYLKSERENDKEAIRDMERRRCLGCLNLFTKTYEKVDEREY